MKSVKKFEFSPDIEFIISQHSGFVELLNENGFVYKKTSPDEKLQAEI